MNTALEFFAGHTALSLGLAILAFFLALAAWRTLRGGFWYLVCIVALSGWAALTGEYPFLFAFLLGFTTAFAELVTKFGDEPLKAVGTLQAFAYHLVNGLVSACALWILEINGAKMDTPLAQAQTVLTAGLGSMLILRSKLFNFKVDDQEVSFGPEQLIKVFFNYMESAIDRVRSRYRVEFIRTTMQNIAFSGVYDYTRAMLDAAQALDKDKKEALLQQMYAIKTETPDEQIRAYKLGFLLTNTMGEDFVSQLYQAKDETPAWQISAPRKDDTDAISKLLSRDHSVTYFAYGVNMSAEEMKRKLGWRRDSADGMLANARVGVLRDFKLVFNCKTQVAGVATGNIVSSPGSFVEGVAYKLPLNVASFLDSVEPGYTMCEITITVKDKPEVAKSFTATYTEPDLRPSAEYMNILIGAARHRGLSEDYIRSLQAIAVSNPPALGAHA